jgi:hypothetical protein
MMKEVMKMSNGLSTGLLLLGHANKFIKKMHVKKIKIIDK